MTPEGLRRDTELTGVATSVRPAGRKFDLTIIGLLMIALGISITLNLTGVRDRTIEPSIAVLPFDSRSTDPENAIFADGIHDDLLTRLANVETLKVISRTSVMDYRGTNKNMRQIAKELGVATILEGAVQRSGDNVRINVQLIDAETDEHLWAHTYDKALTAKNIFEIQSEISAAITTALSAALTPQEKARLAVVPTENMAAYRLYAAGRSNLHARELETLLAARQQFEQAIELDPEFAPAYAGLADAAQLLYINHQALGREEARTIADNALQTALTLDDALAEGHASLGLFKMSFIGDQPKEAAFVEAEAALQRAIELSPSLARAYMWMASLRERQGRHEEAIALNKRSVEFDPIGRIPYANLPVLYARMGRNDEALQQWIEALRIHPTWPTLYMNISVQLETLGRLDEAVAWATRARELSSDPLVGQNLARIYVAFGQYEAALGFVNAVPREHPLYEVMQAYRSMIRNDHATALSILELTYPDPAKAPHFVHGLISDLALLTGDLDKAQVYLLRQQPSFAVIDQVLIDDDNYDNAIKLAFLLQQHGDHQQADRLLSLALEVARGIPRLGVKGSGIRDAQIFALQGLGDEALSALRQAVDQGFRALLPYNGWTLQDDPYLADLRDRPEFRAIIAEIDSDVAIMRQRVEQAETSGDWSDLLGAARTTLNQT